MHKQLEQLLLDLANFANLGADARADCRRRAARCAFETDEAAESFLSALAELAESRSDDQALRNDQPLWTALLGAVHRGPSQPTAHIQAETVQRATSLYRWLGPDSQARHLLLGCLAASERRDALAAFAELVVADPPARPQDAALAFVPLFQRRDDAAKALFPRLLDALEHPAVAAVVLDLANFLCRERKVSPHPASSRVTQLAALLGGLVSRLARLEEQPREFAATPAALHAMVGECVELIVTLCHALGMIGDASVCGKLHQALELSHRRLRTEAAFSLAQLGDEEGLKTLAEMAAEPVVRPRALAYLEELGQLSRAREADRSPAARAEGELAAWLALPTQFGMPPQRLELFDSQRQFWPGFTEPVECYLFRYEYRVGDRALSGIAIAGPLLHALRADLADLPPADIYAAYAGWHAEHEAIRELTPEQLSEEQQTRWAQRSQELAERGFQDIQLLQLGRFFDEEAYVAAARKEGQPGVLILDGEQLEWHLLGAGSRSLGPGELYLIHKGRKLLRAFNPD